MFNLALRNPFVVEDVVFGDLLDSVFKENNYPVSVKTKSFPTDVRETDEQFIVIADVPGVSADQLDISYENEMLKIKYENQTNTESTEKSRYHIKERSVSNLSRSFKLPKIDADSIAAKLDNGVLTVKVNKVEESKVKRVKIETKTR